MKYLESELIAMAEKAKESLKSDCPLIEDEAIVWALETINRYRIALKEIKRHMKISSSGMHEHSAVWQIAAKALAEGE